MFPNGTANSVRDLPVVVCMDTDEVGEVGAQKCAAAFAPFAKEVRIIRLLFKAEGRGKDLRDYLTEGDSYDDLLALREAATSLDRSSDAAANKLPTVTLPGGSTTITSAADILGKRLAATGEFYDHGGAISRLHTDENQQVSLSLVLPTALASHFERVATLQKEKRNKHGGIDLVPDICSESTARRIGASDAFLKAMPPINSVSRCAVLVEAQRSGRTNHQLRSRKRNRRRRWPIARRVVD